MPQGWGYVSGASQAIHHHLVDSPDTPTRLFSKKRVKNNNKKKRRKYQDVQMNRNKQEMSTIHFYSFFFFY